MHQCVRRRSVGIVVSEDAEFSLSLVRAMISSASLRECPHTTWIRLRAVVRYAVGTRHRGQSQPLAPLRLKSTFGFAPATRPSALAAGRPSHQMPILQVRGMASEMCCPRTSYKPVLSETRNPAVGAPRLGSSRSSRRSTALAHFVGLATPPLSPAQQGDRPCRYPTFPILGNAGPRREPLPWPRQPQVDAIPKICSPVRASRNWMPAKFTHVAVGLEHFQPRTHR